MPNKDIRDEARKVKVPMWRIAEALGISEPTMTRKLRTEMLPEEKSRIREIIGRMSAKNEANCDCCQNPMKNGDVYYFKPNGERICQNCIVRMDTHELLTYLGCTAHVAEVPQ